MTWLDEQFEWMTRTLAFLEQNFPDVHKDLLTRLAIHMSCPTKDTPRRVTEMILEELKQIQNQHEPTTSGH